MPDKEKSTTILCVLCAFLTQTDAIFVGMPCASELISVLPKDIDYMSYFVHENSYIREGASIGANSTVVCGNTIGKYAMIASGAVVTADVPDYALMKGVPAKQSGWCCKCGSVLKNGLICDRCGRKYTETDGKLVDMEDVK